MQSAVSDLQGTRLTLETGVTGRDDLIILERKGLGHPDTLADHLGEALSRAYSAYCQEHFGVILHHNFDKLALLGGSSKVVYGGGQMLSPVRVLVNGRAARSCGGEAIPLERMVTDVVNAFFTERLPAVVGNLSIEMNVTTNSSPGAVHVDGADAPERSNWFNPSSVADLRETKHLFANDTSLGTGWAPLHPFEAFALDLVNYLSGPDGLPSEVPWCGTDVKLMAYRDNEEADVVLCVPQISTAVPGREAYVANCEVILERCRDRAASRLPGENIKFRLNLRDMPEKDELYLTFTGSSIESGDEGVVGRGNRINGLITPLRPMNVEGVNGKNPVYHVGKLYNVVAQKVAAQLSAELDGAYCEVHLVSGTGQALSRPWRAVVRTSADQCTQELVDEVLLSFLDDLPALTSEIVKSDDHFS